MTMDDQPQSSLPTFGLNHAKNYFGVPSAIEAPGDTGGLIMGHLVRHQFGTVRRGATELGLITENLDVTPLGDEVAEFAKRRYGSHTDALEQFRAWKGTHTRFVDLDEGAWRVLAAQVMHEYDPARRVADVLRHSSGSQSLPEFIALAGEHDTRVAELFLSQANIDQFRPLSKLDSTDPRLDDRSAYRSTAVCQLKGVLYHCGVLTELGSDSGTLVPAADMWALDTTTGCVPITLHGCREEPVEGTV
jgi:hypothetical protein